MNKEILTQERLKELLLYSPDTGVFTRKTRVARSVKVGDIAGSISTGYIRIKIDYKNYLAHRLAFLYMTGAFPVQHTDHINHVRIDNRWVNIREVTQHENNKNASKRRDNKSGCSGVCWNKANKCWTAKIRIDGKTKHIGNFENKKDAIIARSMADIKYGYHINHGNSD